MSNPTPPADTPHLMIFGDLLAESECGLYCHGRDVLRYGLHYRPPGLTPAVPVAHCSASAEMALPVLVRLLRVVLARYPDGELCDRAERERHAVAVALTALEGVL